MAIPSIDTAYLVEFLVRLLNLHSPTGFTDQAIEFCRQQFAVFPLSIQLNRKGALIATWPGRKDSAPRGLTAHVDTLGAMVKEIKSNGRLKLTKVGGFAWNTVEGEGATIYTTTGAAYRGALLLSKASSHVYGAAVTETKRDDDAMEVRLDERTISAEETRKLGIQVGDFVAFDPRVETRNGFIRSRHLDDKACVACIAAAFKALKDAGLQPVQTTTALITNFEEVGHGASTGFPPDLAELVAVDMAAIGEGQTSDEFHSSLCVKDGGGPYHHGLSQKLRRLADAENIPYRVDIYTYYGSDGSAYLRAGGNVAVGLIGPGVDASHNYERTHLDALVATAQWILAYLLSED
jgi:putative aminopeptidase FrvX